MHIAHRLSRTRHLGVVFAVTTTLTSLGQVVSAPVAIADTTPYCTLKTDGCFIDRYDDPTIDFGDLDNADFTSATASVTTDNYPYRRTAPSGSGVTFRGLTNIPAGTSGVDIALYDPNLNKNAQGVAQFYLPCKNTNDPYKGACMSAAISSYYVSRSFAGGSSSNPYPVGMLVGNSTTNTYCNPCSHNWGQRIYEADLEFYPKKPGSPDTDPNWVRPRFTSRNEFSASPGGNGYNMTPDWGTIAGRYISDSGVGRLSGNVYSTTGVADTGSNFIFSAFPKTPAGTSSTGKPVGSFYSGADGGNGFYSSGAMYAGVYNLKVLDKRNGHSCYFAARSWTSIGLRADFIIDRNDSGTPTRPPMRWGRTDYSSCNF